MPSILKSKARRVLKYFYKHGFSDIKLTIYINGAIKKIKGTKSGNYRGKWKFTYQSHTSSALEAQ